MPAPPAAPGQNKRRKRKETDSIMSEAEGGSFEVYQSAALTFQNTGQFQKAIDNYRKALDMREGDKNCLVARSQCYLQLGDAEKALKDAEETLKDDKNYIKGILQQAESYYQMGQFEFALMHYHRGNKLRPEVQAFRLGIQKAQEAIDNSIGDAAGIQLTKDGDLSYFYEEQQNTKRFMRPMVGAVGTAPPSFFKKKAMKATAAAATQQKRGYGRPQTRERKKQKQKRSQGQDQKTVKQLLGDLYADKEYLEQLLKETESAGNQSETNKEVHMLAEDCLNYLDTRSAFWQQQKPMYSRKNEKKQKNRRKSADGKRDANDWVLRRLEQIDDAQADGKYEESLKLAKKTLKEVDKFSDDDLQNRPEVVASLHSCMGNAHLEMGKYGKALEHHVTDQEIGRQHDIEESQSRALDNIGRVYARMGEYEKAIEVWEKKIPIVKSALECTWLYHELGRCHLELGNFNDANNYGEKSLAAAEESDDEVWQLNATVLIAQCQVRTREYQAAVDSFDKALEMAKVQGDKAAESAVRKAIEDVNKKIVDQIKEGGEEEEGEQTADREKDGEQQEQKTGENEESVPQIHGRENTVETQVAKDIQQEQLTAREAAANSDAAHGNDSTENDKTKEKHDEDKNFWETYNSAVDDKVKYGEMLSSQPEQKRIRKKAYGYPGGLTTQAASGKGFEKGYDFDFQGTKSKFEETSERKRSGSDHNNKPVQDKNKDCEPEQVKSEETKEQVAEQKQEEEKD